MTGATTDASCSQRSERPRPALQQDHERRTPYVLDPASLPDHMDALYRAAWAICGSPTDAEDLVQTTFARVLARPRVIRRDNARAYLLRALRNTYASRYRASSRRPTTVPLLEHHGDHTQEPPTISSRELMETIAGAPPVYRDAVIAVDILGLSYREAARALRTREETITSRVHRGRQHIARGLTERGI